MQNTDKRNCSVITIHYGRQAHLYNLIRGLEQNTTQPGELLIINMDPDLHFDYKGVLTVRIENIFSKDTGLLPIAQARNLGAQLAKYDRLLFLDVDCIRSVNYIQILDQEIKENDGLIMGTPKYLKQELQEVTTKELEKHSIHHPRRPHPEALTQTDHYELFWSLCFGVTKSNFEVLGGFDENYKGYGAEDTDLAFVARKKKIFFYLSTATAYHQQHSFTRPPLDRIEGILNNCNYFYQKWNSWPMEKTLQQFQKGNYIHFDAEAQKYIQTQKPDQAAIRNATITNEPFA
ncbi:MAG: glycosyltransferase family A protein [Leeuwenhoekiella sp.]